MTVLTRSRSQQLPLTTRQRKQLARLLHQQFWLFGYDVRGPAGNVLIHFGFERQPPPPSSDVKSSRYLKHEGSGTTICLWAFGLYVSTSASTGVFLPRSATNILVHKSPEPLRQTWDPTKCPQFTVAHTESHWHMVGDAIRTAARWIAEYEQSVAREFGIDYRIDAIAAWNKPCCGAHELPREWHTVAGFASAHTNELSAL